MIPALVQTLGSSFNKSAGTTLAHTFTGATTAGNLIVARVLFDNFTTVGKPRVSSIGKMAGETNNWVSLGWVNHASSTTAGAFAGGELMCIQTTVNWSAAAYTTTLDSSVTMKAVHFQEFSGVQVTLRNTVGTAYSTTTTAASAATTGTTPVINDLALGFIFGSNVAAVQAGDNDSTAGTWSAPSGLGSTASSAASNNFGLATYKVLTAATHQTLNNSANMTAGNGVIVAILQPIPDPSITQAAYQLFDETGTESGATALAAQDTAVTGYLSGNDGYGLVRIRLQSTTAVAIPATDDFTLQWEKNASGSWTNVGTGAIIGYNAPSLTEAQATTNRLTGGTGSFTAGKISEDGVVDNLGWSGNNYTEVLYSVKLLEAQLAHNDTLRFRVLRNGATTGMTYSSTPTVNISLPVTNLVVDNCSHANVTDNVVVTEITNTTLVVANAAHTQAADNIVIEVSVVIVAFDGFRWRNDDGDEDGATWKAAQNTNASLDVGSTARLRTLIDATAMATITPTLYYKKTSDSTWLPVPVGPGAAPVPPTLVAVTSISGTTVWGATESKDTAAALTWQTGDLIVVMATTEQANGTGEISFNTPTATGLTFAAIGSAADPANGCWLHKWSATAAGAGSDNITVQKVEGGTNTYGYVHVWQWRNHGGLGVHAASQTGTTPTVSLTVAEDSAVMAVVGDWNAVVTALAGSPTSAPTPTERADGNVSARYSFAAYDWVDVAAGTRGYGVTSGTSRDLTIGAVEVLAAAAPTSPAPLLAYNFAETGTTVTDRSGNGRHAVLLRGSTPTDLHVSGEFLPSDSTDSLTFASDSATRPAIASVTAKVRILGSQGTGCVWTRMRAGGSSTFNLYVQTGNVNAIVRGSSGVVVISGPALSLNTTYQFALTYDGTTARLYIDGVVALTSTDTSGNLDWSGTNFDWMVYNHPDNPMTMAPFAVDDIRFFDVALTAPQVAALAALPVSEPSSNPVYIKTSANITAGGEPTTAQLTPPAGTGPAIYDSFTGTNGSAWSASRWEDAVWEGAASTPDIQSNTGRLFPTSGAYYSEAIRSVSSWGDTDISGTVTWDSTSEAYFSIGWRAASWGGDGTSTQPLTGYSMERSVGSGDLTLFRYNGAGARTTLTTGSSTASAGPLLWRVQAIGTTIRAKYWSGAEPGTWNVSATDSTYTSGKLTFTLANGGAGTQRTAMIDDLIDNLASPTFSTGRMWDDENGTDAVTI